MSAVVPSDPPLRLKGPILFLIAAAAVLAAGYWAETDPAIRAQAGAWGIAPGWLGSATYFGLAAKVGGAIAFLGLLRLALPPRIPPRADGPDKGEARADDPAGPPRATAPAQPRWEWQRRLAAKAAPAPDPGAPRQRRAPIGLLRKLAMLVLAAAMAALLAVNYGDRVAALLPDGLLPGAVPAEAAAAPAEAAAAATVAPAPAPPAAPAAAPVADRILAHAEAVRDAVAGALAPALAQIRAGLAGVDAHGAQAWLADRAAAARAGDLQAIGALGALAGAGLGVLLLAWFFAALLRALRPPRPPRRRAIRA